MSNIIKTTPKIDWGLIEKEITSKYMHAGHIVGIFKQASESGENIILTGPGGYGKTELSTKILSEMFGGDVNQPFSLGKESRFDDFFGGLDMQKLMNDNQLTLAFDQCVFNHQGVFIDEIYDGNDFVIEKLKAFLLGKVYCHAGNSTACYNSQHRIVVGATNRSRTELLNNAESKRSMEAFSERFVYQMEVVWPSHKAKDYFGMLEKAVPTVRVDKGTKAQAQKFASILEELCKLRIVSPRTAMKLWRGYCVSDFNTLFFYLTGIFNDPEVVEKETKKLLGVSTTTVETQLFLSDVSLKLKALHTQMSVKGHKFFTDEAELETYKKEIISAEHALLALQKTVTMSTTDFKDYKMCLDHLVKIREVVNNRVLLEKVLNNKGTQLG